MRIFRLSLLAILPLLIACNGAKKGKVVEVYNSTLQAADGKPVAALGGLVVVKLDDGTTVKAMFRGADPKATPNEGQEVTVRPPSSDSKETFWSLEP